ncbi:hypothetical protein MKX03_014305 [Papaver bracteatum]|nr:hypothetical protein MKX03_014305 [Papaver bracteatum]
MMKGVPAENLSHTISNADALQRPKDVKPLNDMSVEERITAADQRKIVGNVFFKNEKLVEAMEQYKMAISYMGSNFMLSLSGKQRAMAVDVKTPCHLNMAMCLIKLKRYEEAVIHCSTVFTEDETNVKALFRRGKARAELGQTDAARDDFLKARKYAPEEKAIAKELHLLVEQEKAFKQKQKDFYKGIFGPSPEKKEISSEQMIENISEFAAGPKLKRRWQQQEQPLYCRSFTIIDSDFENEDKKTV